MIQICKFNSVRDFEEVVPDLAVDISEVMATHTVVSTGDSTPYTKETDISQVGHYLRDKIQTAIAAMSLGRSIAAQAQAGSQTSASSPAQEG